MKRTRYEEGMVSYRAYSGTIGWRNYRGWQLHINQGWRGADLLAHTDSAFLFEYEMPNGKRCLHEVGIDRNGEFAPVGASVSRTSFPARWQLAEWFTDPHEIYGSGG